jgi:hypothetical protein
MENEKNNVGIGFGGLALSIFSIALACAAVRLYLQVVGNPFSIFFRHSKSRVG